MDEASEEFEADPLRLLRSTKPMFIFDCSQHFTTFFRQTTKFKFLVQQAGETKERREVGDSHERVEILTWRKPSYNLANKRYDSPTGRLRLNAPAAARFGSDGDGNMRCGRLFWELDWIKSSVTFWEVSLSLLKINLWKRYPGLVALPFKLRMSEAELWVVWMLVLHRRAAFRQEFRADFHFQIRLRVYFTKLEIAGLLEIMRIRQTSRQPVRLEMWRRHVGLWVGVLQLSAILMRYPIRSIMWQQIWLTGAFPFAPVGNHIPQAIFGVLWDSGWVGARNVTGNEWLSSISGYQMQSDSPAAVGSRKPTIFD